MNHITTQLELEEAVQTIYYSCELLQGEDNKGSIHLLAGLAANCDEQALIDDMQPCNIPVPSEEYREVILHILAPLETLGLVAIDETGDEKPAISFTFFPSKVMEVARFQRLTAF